MGDARGIPVPRTSVYLPRYKWHGVSPKNADLEHANMGRANLTDAYVSKEQLRSAKSLEGATMPDGQKYEEWLKSTRAAGRMGRTVALSNRS
jgi:hypothetical protein